MKYFLKVILHNTGSTLTMTGVPGIGYWLTRTETLTAFQEGKVWRAVCMVYFAFRDEGEFC